jgi:hypothetical protein
MAFENMSLITGKIHRQLEGEDQRLYSLSGKYDGQSFVLRVLLPAATDREVVLKELLERAQTITAMFAGTPFTLLYDGTRIAEAPVTEANQHSRQIFQGL